MAAPPGNNNASRRAWRQTDEHRQKIQVSLLLRFLTEHIQGKREMSQTQLKAADILLSKAMPNLKSVDMAVFQGERTQEEVVNDLTALITDRPELGQLLLSLTRGAGEVPAGGDTTLPH